MQNRSRLLPIAACFLSAFFASCQKSNQQPQQPAAEASQAQQPSPQPQQPAATAASQAQPAESGKLKSKRAESQGSNQAAAAPQPSQPPQPTVQTYTVPAGATVSIRLSDTLDSGQASRGAQFSGSLSRALAVSGVVVAPAGSAVTGEVTNAVSSGRLNRPAELSLALTAITPTGGSPVSITTNPLSRSGASHKKRDAVLMGGGAGVGALIGGLAGKGKGAAIGALVGGGAGTAGAAATGKKEIHLAAETPLSFSLSQPASFTVTVSP